MSADVNECDLIRNTTSCARWSENHAECLDVVQKCHTCTDDGPGFSCSCDPGFHLWSGDQAEVVPPRGGESGDQWWHVLAVNVSCVRAFLLPSVVE